MSALHLHHVSHGNHPVGVVGYLLVLLGFASAAIWLVALGTGNTAASVVFGLVALVAFIGAGTILTTMTRRLHHMPMVPDNTEAEKAEYLRDHGR
ncbi:hypothetical protein GCM10009624_13280 [Gordonia sinesedis]